MCTNVWVMCVAQILYGARTHRDTQKNRHIYLIFNHAKKKTYKKKHCVCVFVSQDAHIRFKKSVSISLYVCVCVTTTTPPLFFFTNNFNLLYLI